MTIVNEIKEWIAQGHLKKAIDALRTVAKGTDYESEVTLLSSRYNGLQKQTRMGLLSSEQSNLGYNRISFAIIDLSDRLKHEIPGLLEARVRDDRNQREIFITRNGRTPKPVKIFISYAHKDEKFKDELELHLKILQRRGIIETFSDREVRPGEVWESEISAKLLEAEIVLFLISPDFVGSDYMWDGEVKSALNRYWKDTLVIIPILVRPADIKGLDIDRFQALPTNGKAISQWADRDEAWISVTQGLQETIEAIAQ